MDVLDRDGPLGCRCRVVGHGAAGERCGGDEEPDDTRHGPASCAWPRSLGEWYLLVAEDLREVFTRASAGEGLTFAEGRALRLIGVDAAQQHLTEVLAVDKSRVSAILGRLESLGLIERDTRHGGDRRTRRVRLTDGGSAAVARIGAYLDPRSPLVRRLDDAERRTLFTLLRKIADLDACHDAADGRR